MLTVTEKALEQIARYFDNHEIKPIRVFITSSCSGQQIALALDEARPDDVTFEFDGIQFLVNKNFLTQAQPIEIDFAVQGFKVSSALKLNAGCGGCGSSGTCCS
jgi:iron-sulfur cluster assembly protein